MEARKASCKEGEKAFKERVTKKAKKTNIRQQNETNKQGRSSQKHKQNNHCSPKQIIQISNMYDYKHRSLSKEAMASTTGGTLITQVRRGQGHSRPEHTLLALLFILSHIVKIHINKNEITKQQ